MGFDLHPSRLKDMSLLDEVLQREVVAILADEVPEGYLVRKEMDKVPMERPVLVVNTFGQANDHPQVRSVVVELRLAVRADKVTEAQAAEVLNSASAGLLEHLEDLAEALAEEGIDLRKWKPGDYGREITEERGTEHFVQWVALAFAGERQEPPEAEPV
jgi:hypothetical protein